MATKMTKAMLQSAGTDALLADQLVKVYEKFDDGSPKFVTEEIEHGSGVFKRHETEMNKMLRHEVMKACIQPAIERVGKVLGKTSITTNSNFVPYDLMAPSRHLVPWLSPLRESLPRVKRAGAGLTAHWKTVIAASSSYARGGMPASPWVNNGQRAPEISITALDVNVSYVTMGKDGSVQFEAESASGGFEDALAVGHFFTLETLMVSEEDALIGGNATLKLGQTSTPTGSAAGSGSLSALYCACIALTYEGYRNFVIANGFDATNNAAPLVTTGLTQQLGITTGDGKTMTVNSGCAKPSAISSSTGSSSASVTFTDATPKAGELAYLWYVGTANATSSLYLQALTTVPSLTLTAAPVTTTQLLSSLQAVDFSVNDGSTGGGTAQVKAYDGLITQALNNTSLSPQNAYTLNMKGSLLTTSGKGNVDQLDTLLLSLWNMYKVTIDVIYVNAQELQNITSRVLNGSSAPILRYDRDGDSGEYDLTGSGVISFYFNPYIPGGRKIPIIVHPTLPPGTILAYAKELPSYFKTADTPVVAEVLTRKDYYSQEYAITTREYQFGTYCESALALYAPFCVGLINGVGNG